jgi:capsular exopolysaccharide synthesis family protein
MNAKAVTKSSINYLGGGDDDYYIINPRQVWRTLKSHRRFIGLCIIAAMAISQTFSFLYRSPIYVSSVRLKLENQKSVSISPMLEQLQGGKDQNGVRLASLSDDFYSADFMTLVLLEILKRRYPLSILTNGEITKTQQNHLITQLGDAEKRSLLLDSNEWYGILSLISKRFQMQPQENNIISISALTNNPQLSTNLANITAKLFVNYNLKKLREKSSQLRLFVSEQALEKKVQLTRLEEQLLQLQKEYRMPSTEDFARGKYSLYQKNLEAIDELERKAEITEKMLLMTRQEIKKITSGFINNSKVTSELYLSQLQHRINLLQYQKAVSLDKEATNELTRLTEEYQKVSENREREFGFEVASSDEYIRSLRKTATDLNRQKQQILLERQTLSKTASERADDLTAMPEVLQKFERLKRKIQLASDLYLNLQKRQQEVEFMDAGINNDLKILSKGLRPSEPIGISTVARYVVSGIVGLLFACLMIVLKNVFIQTVRSFRELQAEGINVIGEVPLVPHLGVPSLTPIDRNIDQFLRRMERMVPHIDKFIPYFRNIRSSFRSTQQAKKSELIVLHTPHSSEADVFRFMRLRMNSFVNTQVRKNDLGTVCLVTSPTEKNGKTFVTTNLAASFAMGDIKTLVIDLDLRNPSLKRLFPEYTNIVGIDSLFDGVDLEKCIININKNLDVVFCANHVKNPTDFLESKELRDFIQKQRQKYYYIFIDSPPVLAVCDPSLLAPISDVIVMVAGYEVTFREDIQLAIEGLHSGKNLPIIGVLNLVNRSDKYSYYYNTEDSQQDAA